MAKDEKLDRETLDRWLKQIQKTPREHPFLNDWDALVKREAPLEELRVEAEKFQDLLLVGDSRKENGRPEKPDFDWRLAGV